MMRLWTAALAPLLATTPLAAAELSDRAKIALALQFVDAHCPNYRLDVTVLDKTSARLATSESELAQPEVKAEIARRKGQMSKAPDTYCTRFWVAYGPAGTAVKGLFRFTLR